MKAIVASLKSLKASELGAKRSALVEAKKTMINVSQPAEKNAAAYTIAFLASTNADLLATLG